MDKIRKQKGENHMERSFVKRIKNFFSATWGKVVFSLSLLMIIATTLFCTIGLDASAEETISCNGIVYSLDGATAVTNPFEKTYGTAYLLSDGTLIVTDWGNSTTTDPSSYPWHKYSSLIKKVVFADDVTEVKPYAFQNVDNKYYTKITSVDFNNVQTVGKYAFGYCASLVSVNIPDATAIGEYAFSNCQSLTSVSMPNVTTIYRNAFSNCYTLASADMPSVTSIYTEAFGYCNLLTYLNMPNVTTIGISAFKCSFDLAPVDTTIVRSAVSESCVTGYSWSGANRTVTFMENPPDNIPETDENPETGDTPTEDETTTTDGVPTCSTTDNTATVALGDFALFETQWDSDADNFQWLFSKDGGNAWSNVSGEGTNTLSLTSCTAQMSGYQYKCVATNESGTLTGESGVFTLKVFLMADDVSYDLTGAKELSDASYGYGYLLADGTTLIVTGWGTTTTVTGSTCINYPWYDYGTNIASVIFADSVTEVRSYAFFSGSNYTSLSYINFNNVQTINEQCFKSIQSITEINAPECTSVGTRSFDSCSNVTTINMPKVLSVGESSFQYCKSLTTVNMPCLTSIGWGSFADCTGLVDISFPSCITVGSSSGGNAFIRCSGLETVSLPNCITLNSNSFANCTSLTEVYCPNVTTVSRYAFNNCSSLTSVSLEKVETIGYQAFYNCSSLTNLDLSSVSSFENYSSYAFYVSSSTPTTVMHTDTSKSLVEAYLWSKDNREVTFVAKVAENYPVCSTTDTTVSVPLGESVSFETQWDENAKSFQWMVSVDNGVSWTNMESETSSSLSLTKCTLDMSGYQYKCVATNETLTGNSGVFTLEVNPPSTCKVEFDLDGGEAVNGDNSLPVQSVYGEELTLPTSADVSKNGYVFAGWKKVGDDTNTIVTSVPADNVVDNSFVALWTMVTYDITYANVDNSVLNNPDTYTVETDDFTLVGTPTHAGQTFTGWKENNVFKNDTPFLTFTVPKGAYGNLSFEAVFANNNYTVSYERRGGYFVEGFTPVTSHEYSTDAVALPDEDYIKKAGYTFEGWYTDLSDESTKTTVIPSDLSDNITYYAKWTANDDVSYMVQHYKANLNHAGYELVETETFTGTADSEVTPKVKTYTGFASPEAKTVTISADGSRVVQYKYERNSYTITVTASENTDSVTGGGSYEYGDTVTISATAKEGYDFAYWNEDKEGNRNAQMSVTVESDKTYTAYSTPIAYALNLTLNGGSYETGKENLSTFTIADAFTLNNPEREGYKFLGWTSTSTGTDYVLSYEVAKGTKTDLSLYAQWEKLTYTVTLNENGGTWNSSKPTLTKVYGEELALPNADDISRTGYYFGGWKVSESSEPVMVVKADVNENISLTAYWIADTDVIYKVEHYKEKLNSDSFELFETTSLAGTADTEVTPDVKDYEGFTAPSKQAVTISADGKLVVKYYYTRNSYTVTVEGDDNIASVSGEGSYEYGDTVTISATAKEGYDFAYWNEDKEGNRNAQMSVTVESDKTYTAYSTPIAYALNLTLNGGSYETGKKNPSTFTIADAFTLNNPEREGYKFLGWTSTSTGTDYVLSYAVAKGTAEDLTLYAQWEKLTYTVTLNENGGTWKNSKPTLTKVYGEELSLPNADTISRTGYYFGGWKITADAEPIMKIEAGANENITLTAYWIANTDVVYKVEHYKEKLNSDDYELFETTSLAGTADAEVTPDVKDYEGFTAPSKQTVTISADGKLVVKYYYTRNSYEITVEGYNNISSVSGSGTYEYGDTVTISATAKEGYEFAYWNEDKEGNRTYEMAVDVLSSTKYTAYSKTIDFRLNLTLNGGSYETGKSNPTTFTVEDTFTLNNPVREGYKFLGWTSTNADTDYVLAYEVAKGTTENITLYAQWEKLTYTVTLNENGGTWTSSKPTLTKVYGEKLSLPNAESISRTGYYFGGWKITTDAEPIMEVKAGVNENISLTAYWIADTDVVYKVEHYKEKLNSDDYELFETTSLAGTADSEVTPAVKTYEGFTAPSIQTVTISADGKLVVKYYYTRNSYEITVTGDANISSVSGSGTYEYGDSVTILATAKEGYDFAYWNEDKEGNREPSLTFKVEEDASYRAVARAIKYELNLSLNGGSYETGKSNPTKFTVEDSFTLNNPVREGYEFLGWSITADGADYVLSYAVEKGTCNDITLYAQWERLSHLISFDANGGAFGDGYSLQEYQIREGDSYGEIETPVYENHTFEGWYTSADGGSLVDVSSDTMDFTANTTLYARWSKDDLSVSLEKDVLTTEGENVSKDEMLGVVTNDENASMTLNVSPSFLKGGDTSTLKLSLYYVTETEEILVAEINMDGTSVFARRRMITGIQAGFSEVTSDNAVIVVATNGRYKVVAVDRTDESIVAESQIIEVTHFDTAPPEITSVILSEKNVSSRRKTITVTATDGVAGYKNVSALDSAGSYFIEKADTPRTDFADVTWEGYDSSSYAWDVTENGTYYVYVKDYAGNITSYDENPVVVTNIDTVAPMVSFHDSQEYITADGLSYLYTGLEIASGDGINEDLTYYAFDNIHQKEVSFKVTASDTEGFFTNVALMTDKNGNTFANQSLYGNGSVWFAFTVTEDVNVTVTVTDEAGNQSSCDIVIHYVPYDHTVDGMPLLNGNGYISIAQSPSDWTGESTLLTPSITGLSYEGSCFLWTLQSPLEVEEEGTLTGAGAWGMDKSYSVTENKTYYLYVKTTDNKVYYQSHTVSNIDKESPVVSGIQVSSDGSTVSFTVSDLGSGLMKVSGNGGTQSSIREVTGLNGIQSKTFTFPISGSCTYSIIAIDRCGNKTEIKRNITVSLPSEEDSDGVHTVTFLTYSGGIVKAQSVKHGEDATPPANLTREGYLFTGWDKSYVNVTRNLTISAVWEKAEKEEDFYTVSFTGYNDVLLKSEKVKEGGTATPPKNPVRDGYTFVGWDAPYAGVTRNTVVNAIWERKQEEMFYNVTFASFNGAILKVEKVKEGGTATPPKNPTREGFTFVGWDIPYAGVTKDTVVNAIWLKQKGLEEQPYYVVVFLNWDDSVIEAESVRKGGTATPPIATRTGYTFTGWSNGYANVNGDVVTKAMFAPNVVTNSSTVSTAGVTVTSSTGSTSSANKQSTDVTTKKEETKSESTKKEDTALNSSAKEKQTKIETVTFEDFSKKATPLSVSSSDNTPLTNPVKEPTSEKVVITDIYEKTNESVENTQDGEYKENGLPVGSMVAIMALLGGAGFGGFYLLNKKYRWVSLPF